MSVSLCRYMRVTTEVKRVLESQTTVSYQRELYTELCTLRTVLREQHATFTTEVSH